MLLKVNEDGSLANMHVSKLPWMGLFRNKIIYPTEDKPDGGEIITIFQPPGDEKTTELTIPLQPAYQDLDTVDVNMHNSPMTAYNMGPKYNEWFSDCFKYPVILAYVGDKKRKVLGNLPPAVAAQQGQGQGKSKSTSWLSSVTSYIPSLTSGVAGVDDGIGFADCAPYLVVTSKSWEEVNARLETEEMEIEKFRPNIIVEGSSGHYDEDYWAELAVGDLKIVLTANCARCASLTVDYETGDFGKTEAGQILRKLQKNRRVDPGFKWSPIFGRYGFLDQGNSGLTIHVGDEVEVLKKNSERTVWGKSYQYSCVILGC